MGLSFSRHRPGEYQVHDDDRVIGLVRRASTTKPGGRWEAELADGTPVEGEFLTRRLAAAAIEDALEG